MTSKPTDRLAPALTSLFVLQFLHGLAPAPEDQPVEGGWTGLIGGVVFLVATAVAWYWVRRGDERGRSLAYVLGLAIPAGFVLYHAAWFSTPLTNPYWGDGSATLLQWISVVAVMASGFWVAYLARSGARASEVTPTA